MADPTTKDEFIEYAIKHFTQAKEVADKEIAASQKEGDLMTENYYHGKKQAYSHALRILKKGMKL